MPACLLGWATPWQRNLGGKVEETRHGPIIGLINFRPLVLFLVPFVRCCPNCIDASLAGLGRPAASCADATHRYSAGGTASHGPRILPSCALRLGAAGHSCRAHVRTAWHVRSYVSDNQIPEGLHARARARRARPRRRALQVWTPCRSRHSVHWRLDVSRR